jgi:hypothetical protein
MSRTLKWILGIGIGVIVLAALVTAGFVIFTQWAGADWMMGGRAFRNWDEGRSLPGWDMPMHRFDRPFGGMHGSRFFGFSPLGWILGGLLRLGFWVLVIAGVVALVRVLWRSQPAATTPAPTVQPSLTCPNCSFPIQAGWKHCPNCAHNLSE